jgi:zinc transporter ZupT
LVADALVGAQSTRDTTIIIIVVTISGFIIIIGAIISALLFWRSQRYKKLLLEVHKSKILHPSLAALRGCDFDFAHTPIDCVTKTLRVLVTNVW